MSGILSPAAARPCLAAQVQPKPAWRRLIADSSGASAAIFALSTTVTVGMMAFVIDVGNMMASRRELQAATDSAALAGAAAIGTGQYAAVAAQYGATDGSLNESSSFTATGPAGFPQARRLTSVGVSCSNSDGANAVVVRHNAEVPMIFGRIIGLNRWRISATATAGLAGGTALPIEVMVVLDVTNSMNQPNNSCSVAGSSRLTCALAGARAMVSGMSPSTQRVGLMAFPGAANAAEARKNYDCSASSPSTVRYSANPVYQVVALSDDYRAGDNADGLNTASDFAKAVKGGEANCQQGMSAPGGYGTFYADAINAAQGALERDGRADVQRVIVLLSDGDANASAANMTASKRRQQCQQAVAAANTAAAAGTWVYSVAYGASTSASGSCATDTTPVSACATMASIASEPSRFYVGNNGGGSGCSSNANSASDLVEVFRSIARSFKKSRLLPDNTV